MPKLTIRHPDRSRWRSCDDPALVTGSSVDYNLILAKTLCNLVGGLKKGQVGYPALFPVPVTRGEWPVLKLFWPVLRLFERTVEALAQFGPDALDSRDGLADNLLGTLRGR